MFSIFLSKQLDFLSFLQKRKIMLVTILFRTVFELHREMLSQTNYSIIVGLSNRKMAKFSLIEIQKSKTSYRKYVGFEVVIFSLFKKKKKNKKIYFHLEFVNHIFHIISDVLKWKIVMFLRKI